MILNLIVNAIDATRGVDDGPRDVVVSSGRHSEGVCVAVRDSGVGLASETLDQLFKPFVSSKGEGGMGMGLYMAKLIIDSHAGEIAVLDRPQGGARFEVRLKAVEDKPT